MAKVNEKTKMRAFVLLIFAFICPDIFSQQTTLTGAIVIGKAEVMSYKISYHLTGNKLTGFSISDVNGNGETKAAISGTYNPKNKEFNFEESKLISTKAQIPHDEFCLMKVAGKLEKKNGKLIYTGKFQHSQTS